MAGANLSSKYRWTVREEIVSELDAIDAKIAKFARFFFRCDWTIYYNCMVGTVTVLILKHYAFYFTRSSV